MKSVKFTLLISGFCPSIYLFVSSAPGQFKDAFFLSFIGESEITPLAESNKVNNNVESKDGEIFSPIRDRLSSGKDTSNTSPAAQNSSLNKFSDGIFSPLASDNSRNSTNNSIPGLSPYGFNSRSGVENMAVDQPVSILRNSASHDALKSRDRIKSDEPSRSHGLSANKVELSASHGNSGLSGALSESLQNDSHTYKDLSKSAPSLHDKASSAQVPGRSSLRTSPSSSTKLPTSVSLPKVTVASVVDTSLNKLSQSRNASAAFSQEESAGAGLGDMPAGGGAVGGGDSAGISSFQMTVLKNLVEEAMDEFRDQVSGLYISRLWVFRVDAFHRVQDSRSKLNGCSSC